MVASLELVGGTGDYPWVISIEREEVPDLAWKPSVAVTMLRHLELVVRFPVSPGVVAQSQEQ